MTMTKPNASQVVFDPSGTGAVPTTVQSKLRSTLINRSEYATSGDFDAAVAASPYTPSIDGGGNFNAKITPAAEPAQLDLNQATYSVAAGPRDAVVYANATSVSVFRNHAHMGGFRYRGQYTKGRAPVFPMPASKVASVSGSGLGAESAVRTENWYAVFACANSGDATATLKTMPFLRVGTPSGANLPLIKAGENVHALTPQTYAWSSANNLSDVDCLVISENGGFSGRVTTITANSTSQVTVSSVGSIAAYDFILPAPPGYTQYVYLGSFYFDTAEVRNIYDTGNLVKAKMIYLTTPNIGAGSIPSPGQIMNCAGYISPLATGVVIDSSCSFSTSSEGGYAEYFDPDGASHIVQTCYYDKARTTTTTNVFSNVQVPFSYFQKFNFYNAGDVGPKENRASGQLNITGWFEP